MHTLIVLGRLANIKYSNFIQYRTELLKVFVSYYESVKDLIDKWVFNSIKTIYLNIINVDMISMKLTDLTESGEQSESVYIQLETRIKGILEGLIASSSVDQIEKNMLKFLAIITSKGSYVPTKFYTLFELSRFKTENSQIK